LKYTWRNSLENVIAAWFSGVLWQTVFFVVFLAVSPSCLQAAVVSSKILFSHSMYKKLLKNVRNEQAKTQVVFYQVVKLSIEADRSAPMDMSWKPFSSGETRGRGRGEVQAHRAHGCYFSVSHCC